MMQDEITREYCSASRQSHHPYEAYEKVWSAWAGCGCWCRRRTAATAASFDYALMREGLARYGFADFATAFMVSTFTAMNICKFGTREQQERFLPAFMKGDIRFLDLHLLEPSAGSDAANTRTRSEETPEGWRKHGQKLWCPAPPPATR